MSIFESPTAVQPRLEDSVVGDPPAARAFDPRSVQIAGAITAALVVLGLVVSHAAQPDSQPPPALSSKVAPGAAAVEERENVPPPAQQSAAPRPTADAQQPAADEPTSTNGDAPAWQEPQTSGGVTDTSGDSKWDRHPGKGHGRWR